MSDELLIPLTEIEKAELSHACSEFLTEPGKSMLRRLLFQVDHAEQQLTARDSQWLAAIFPGGLHGTVAEQMCSTPEGFAEYRRAEKEQAKEDAEERKAMGQQLTAEREKRAEWQAAAKRRADQLAAFDEEQT